MTHPEIRNYRHDVPARRACGAGPVQVTIDYAWGEEAVTSS